ncbi:MAG: hypothetical protein OXM58_09980 [Rhodospirillaceae bacterium]|nr:hypothetical protein [Rhodospirillaceae bacterium]MDE0617198.1 hypothetical protein [Rhodospirillaceae bacterium]
MIRSTTIVLLVLLSGLTGALFLVKHQVQTLEKQVAKAERSVRSYRNNLRILQAEWTVLTSPQRLELLPRPEGLAPLSGGQFKRFSELPDTFAALYALIDEGRAPDRVTRVSTDRARRLQ